MRETPILGHIALLNGVTFTPQDIWICAPLTEGLAALFPTAILAACGDCGEPILYARTAPRAPRKICHSCAVQRDDAPGVLS